jgi:selenocysteine lyase/cysteine desulfurase
MLSIPPESVGVTPRELARLAPRELAKATAFEASYPGYRATAALDELRASEYGYLDADAHAYLDYTGAALPARAQLRAHAERLSERCYGNPHSENPASAASTELIERTRHAVLQYFGAPPEDYTAIFTANASNACRLVGEAYPFGRRRGLVLTSDNHNSVHGIREFARTRGAQAAYVPFGSPQLRVADDEVGTALRRARGGLFAFPAQSNFTGVQHPLGWIDVAHEHGCDVLLDAAAYVPSNRLDLAAHRPDFVAVSWYKMLGYPSGVGCLIARHEALARLSRPWFAGGTVTAVSVMAGWHALSGGPAGFEDGTTSFLHIPDVEFGLSWISKIGIGVIHERVRCLTGWLLDQLGALRHSNGAPQVAIHGPADTCARGGTVAFSLLDPRGGVIDVRAVERDLAAAAISVRTGCFCNPGAAEGAFALTMADVVRARRSNARTSEDYAAEAGIPGGGAVRASVGLASNRADADRLIAAIETTYRDRERASSGSSCPWPDPGQGAVGAHPRFRRARTREHDRRPGWGQRAG